MLSIWFHQILTPAIWHSNYFPHVTDEGTLAQRGYKWLAQWNTGRIRVYARAFLLYSLGGPEAGSEPFFLPKFPVQSTVSLWMTTADIAARPGADSACRRILSTLEEKSRCLRVKGGSTVAFCRAEMEPRKWVLWLPQFRQVFASCWHVGAEESWGLHWAYLDKLYARASLFVPDTYVAHYVISLRAGLVQCGLLLDRQI